MGQLCQGSEDRDIKPKSDPVSLGGNTSPDVKQPRVSPQPIAEESTPGANSPPRTESASPPAGTGQTPEQPADDTTAAAESTELDEESAHQLKMEQQGREIVNMFAEVVIDVVAPAEPPVPDWQQKDIDAIQTTAQTPQILFSDQDCDINVFLKSEQLISPELKAQVDQALELVAAGVAAISVKSQASPVQAFPDVNRQDDQ